MPHPRTVKAAIAADGRHSYEIAAAAHINASMLSGIASGRLTPSPDVRARLAAVLGRNEADLFPDLPTADYVERSCKASNVSTMVTDSVALGRISNALGGRP